LKLVGISVNSGRRRIASGSWTICSLRTVEATKKVFSGCELHELLALHLQGFASFRIPTHLCVSDLGREIPEPSDLYPATFGQMIDDFVEDRVDSGFHDGEGQVRVSFGKLRDEL
jgi:hypothetical protein